MGYTLSLVKNPRHSRSSCEGDGNSRRSAGAVAAAAADTGEEKGQEEEEAAASTAIAEVVTRHVGGGKSPGPCATLLSSSANELVFRLPLGSVGRFEALFRELEQLRAAGRFGLGGFGISMTTLEEVFLKLETTARADDEAAKRQKMNEPVNTRGAASAASGDQVSADGSDSALPQFEEAFAADLPPPSARTHFTELVRKRWLFARRDTKGFCFQIVLPVALIAFVLLILTIDIKLAGQKIVMRSELFWQVLNPVAPRFPPLPL